jgi:hypothetical protein
MERSPAPEQAACRAAALARLPSRLNGAPAGQTFTHEAD